MNGFVDGSIYTVWPIPGIWKIFNTGPSTSLFLYYLLSQLLFYLYKHVANSLHKTVTGLGDGTFNCGVKMYI